MATKIKQQQSIAEKFSKTSTFIRVVLSAIILILIIIIGYYFDTTTQQKELQKLSVKHIYLTTDLNSKKALLATQRITKHKIAIMEQYIDQNQASMSAGYDQSYIIEQLHDIGAKQHIQFTFIKPQKTIFKDFYTILPIQIEATGDYHRIAQLLADISNMKFPIVVTNFSMKHDNKTKQFMTLNMMGNIVSLDPTQIKIKYYPKAVIANSKETIALPKPQATFNYSESSQRNPFTPIDQIQQKQYANVILRSVPLSKIELVGVISEGNKRWAIIMPTGKNDDRITHKATIGDRISQSSALITQIYNDHVSLQKDMGDDDKTEMVTLNIDEDS
jgi:type IV pilus assembly protein PilO